MRTTTSAAALLVAAMWSMASWASAQCGGQTSESDASSSSDESPSCPVDWGASAPASSSSSSRRGGDLIARCVETSDVVGHTRCRRFGDGWNGGDQLPFRVTLGPSFRRLSVGHLSFRGQTDHHNRRHGYGDAGRDLNDPDPFAGGLLGRLDLTFLDYLSVGAEVFGAGVAVGGITRLEGEVSHTPQALLTLGGGLVLGVAIPVDVVTLRAEVLLGGRGVMLHSETRVRDCIGGASSWVAEGVVEPRVGASIFVLPFLSVNAWVGSNVLVPGDLHVVLALGAHTRSYDGQPGR